LKRHKSSNSIGTWLLVAGTVSGMLAACSGKTNGDVDLGQEVPPGSAGTKGSGSGGSGANPAQPGGDANPCGASPCADFTGDKSFVDVDTPADAGSIFDSATGHESGSDAKLEPAIIYPSHETMFPINVSRIRHDWVAGGGDLYQLRFEGPRTTVKIYTTSLTWTPTEEQWDWIAESNRGSSVKLTVSSLEQSAPSDAYASRSIDLYFSDAAVEGAIYYWSTGTKGIMRATVSDPIPQKFYTDPSGGDSESCAACHTLSRDGKRLAVGYNGENLREVSVPDREVIVPVGATDAAPPAPDPMMPMMPKPMMPKPMKDPKADGAMPSAWTTFSPDAKMLLVAANGVLTLIDADTGATIGDNAGIVSIPDKTVATHPDWAATGDRVAITLGTSGGNKDVSGGSIALLTYAAGVWSQPEVVVRSSGDMDNNFFPVWSPDSKYIAFVHAVGKSKDVSAELQLFNVATSEVVSLARLNQRVNNEDGVTGIANSMPTWAPSTKPGTFWLAFSSLRAYSNVRAQDKDKDQIWIAAIDPSAQAPGYAAFWAPFQSTDEGNHRAFWTHASDDKQCRCVDVCGDSLDNDCDGTADEKDCSVCAAQEICGDGIDNDCDCLVDDCNDEICDDGVDNDGDGQVDDEDMDCQNVK
jgi:WD40-like Beta Propeller Repeat